MQGIQELAHAKVNPFLRVLRRREDAFHEIETFMAPITLCDSLELESANAFEFRCDEPGLVGDDNLVVRAARLFFAETNRAPKVRLTLRKEIPHGAGLGGGSSDAAAALRGLNRFFEAGLSSEKLRTLGAQLGSDVSFFVNETAATCSGRGEIVKPASLRVPLSLLLLKSEFGVPSSWAYSRWQATREAAGEIYQLQKFGDVTFVEKPKPDRAARGLPGVICCRDYFYSPALRRKLAIAYSRLSLAIKLALISAGQTASHS